MKFILLVTGPAYGNQKSISAWLFAKKLIKKGHTLVSVFFHLEGVLNANMLNTIVNDNINLTDKWSSIKKKYKVNLNLCVSASLKRGIVSKEESKNFSHPSFNLEKRFKLVSLSVMSRDLLKCDRLVQF